MGVLAPESVPPFASTADYVLIIFSTQMKIMLERTLLDSVDAVDHVTTLAFDLHLNHCTVLQRLYANPLQRTPPWLDY